MENRGLLGMETAVRRLHDEVVPSNVTYLIDGCGSPSSIVYLEDLSAWAISRISFLLACRQERKAYRAPQAQGVSPARMPIEEKLDNFATTEKLDRRPDSKGSRLSNQRLKKIGDPCPKLDTVDVSLRPELEYASDCASTIKQQATSRGIDSQVVANATEPQSHQVMILSFWIVLAAMYRAPRGKREREMDTHRVG